MGYYYDLAKCHLEEATQSSKKRNLKREAKVIDATCNWLIQKVESNLDVNTFQQQVLTFKDHLLKFMNDSMEKLHCANLRTTDSESKLYKMATDCGIPYSALPADISIIVNQEKAFYFEKHSAFQTFIFQ